MIEIRVLGRGDVGVLDRVDADVFDHAIDRDAAREFLADPRHHIVVAMDADVVVGFASGVHYVHPDKPIPELWINELGVASSHRRAGIAKRVMTALLDVARANGCGEAWVLTDRDNRAGMATYASLGGEEAPRDQVMFTFRLDRANP